MQATHKYAGFFSSRAWYALDALEKAIKLEVKQACDSWSRNGYLCIQATENVGKVRSI
jgi:hypothetical protein